MVSNLFIAGVVWGSVVVVAGLTVLAWRQRPRPGATGFALTMLAATWWVASSSIGLFVTDETASVLLGKAEWVGIAYLPVTWLAFALAYTGRSEHLSRRTLAALSALPTATLAFALTNDTVHELLFGPPTFHSGETILLVERSFGPWFWVHVAYTYLLLAVGTALVLQVVVERRLLYRGQALALVLVVLAPWAGSALYLGGYSPVPFFDPTPFTFVISGVAGIAALTQLEFLDAVPVTSRVAHRSVVQNVDAGVLVADTGGQIVEANPRARTLLADDDAPLVGERLYALLPDDDSRDAGETGVGGPGSTDSVDGSDARTPDSGPDSGDAPYGQDPTDATDALPDEAVVGGDAGERTRFVEVRETELTDGHGNPTGRIVLLRDVTERHDRSQRLNVLNRVLRHNLRNEMNVVYGYADRLADGEADPESVATDVREKATDLVELANTAREIDRLLGESAREPTDLCRIAEIERRRVDEAYTDVAVEARTPSEPLAVHAAAGTVVRHVVENAAEHNSADDPRVRVDVEREEDRARVEVVDNGPGIPDGELAALHGDTETQLDHASGLGLWLVRWGLTTVGGTVDVTDRPSGGTRVTLAIPIASNASTDDLPGEGTPATAGTSTGVEDDARRASAGPAPEDAVPHRSGRSDVSADGSPVRDESPVRDGSTTSER